MMKFTGMRVVCLVIVVQAISIVGVARGRNYGRQNNYVAYRSFPWEIEEDRRTSPEVNVDQLSASTIAYSSRNKRDDSVVEGNSSQTRHGKRRRRRRCRNRPACPRAGAATKQRHDDTDVASNSSVIAKKEETKIDYAMSKKINDKGITDDDSRSREIDTYDDRTIFDEDFNDSSIIYPWMTVEPDDYETLYEDLTFSENMGVLLRRLFQTLRNTSLEGGQDLLKELNFVEDDNQDPCQKWLNSKDKFEEAFLGPLVNLPACPCHYPNIIFYEDKIWDERQGKYFRWRDVSGDSQRLDVYKPGASYCVRSLLTQATGSAAVQHCCYDRTRKLLTRGSGAGTPIYVSPEISLFLHKKIDILPWRLCKGDFSRFNRVRPPNNGNNCEINPDDEEYQRQINDKKHY